MRNTLRSSRDVSSDFPILSTTRSRSLSGRSVSSEPSAHVCYFCGENILPRGRTDCPNNDWDVSEGRHATAAEISVPLVRKQRLNVRMKAKAKSPPLPFCDVPTKGRYVILREDGTFTFARKGPQPESKGPSGPVYDVFYGWYRVEMSQRKLTLHAAVSHRYEGGGDGSVTQIGTAVHPDLVFNGAFSVKLAALSPNKKKKSKERAVTAAHHVRILNYRATFDGYAGPIARVHIVPPTEHETEVDLCALHADDEQSSSATESYEGDFIKFGQDSASPRRRGSHSTAGSGSAVPYHGDYIDFSRPDNDKKRRRQRGSDDEGVYEGDFIDFQPSMHDGSDDPPRRSRDARQKDSDASGTGDSNFKSEYVPYGVPIKGREDRDAKGAGGVGSPSKASPKKRSSPPRDAVVNRSPAKKKALKSQDPPTRSSSSFSM